MEQTNKAVPAAATPATAMHEIILACYENNARMLHMNQCLRARLTSLIGTADTAPIFANKAPREDAQQDTGAVGALTNACNEHALLLDEYAAMLDMLSRIV